MNEEIEKEISFVVPLVPPSVNHTYLPTMYTGRDGYGHRGRKLSKQAIAYKHAVAIFSRGRTITPASEKDRRTVRYGVELRLYLGKNQRLDGDNAGKLAIDALVYAGVIHADHRVGFTVHPPERDWDNPRTEYRVWRMDD